MKITRNGNRFTIVANGRGECATVLDLGFTGLLREVIDTMDADEYPGGGPRICDNSSITITLEVPAGRIGAPSESDMDRKENGVPLV